MLKLTVILFLAIFVAFVAAFPGRIPPPTSSSSSLDQCKKSCKIQSYHLNPVCGTDNQSYPNEDIMKCYNSCGHNVSVASKGFCRKDLPKSFRE